MSQKIGIFTVQEKAIEAVQALESQGFKPDELKVFAKDHEHSKRIESETDAHADELNDLAETRQNSGGDTIIPGIAGLMGLGAYGVSGYAGGTGSTGTSAGVGAPALGAGLFLISGLDGDRDSYDSALHSLGLDDEEADICRKAIHGGSLIVVAEADEEASSADSSDGSRLAAAEEALRSCGAEQVL